MTHSSGSPCLSVEMPYSCVGGCRGRHHGIAAGPRSGGSCSGIFGFSLLVCGCQLPASLVTWEEVNDIHRRSLLGCPAWGQAGFGSEGSVRHKRRSLFLVRQEGGRELSKQVADGPVSNEFGPNVVRR